MTVEQALSIGEIAARTGVSESTLRMWESRHGFPKPARLASGRRAYSRRDLDQISTVLQIRSEGLSLPAAIERTRRMGEPPRLSVYRALRENFPHLHPRDTTKQALLWMTRAVEDECSVRSEKPLLIGCFQEERFFRQSERRWRHLARQGGRAIALAAFTDLRIKAGNPAEIPLDPADTLLREWAVICHDRDFSICVVGRERPEGELERRFEVIWTVEPMVVVEAARVCLSLVARTAPELAGELEPLISCPVRPVGASDLQTALDLASRATNYAAGDNRGRTSGGKRP
ncbi:MAG: MerR family transcriptional regulator [Solirubrobacterales bacterium]|nr:MerR family transcriptional regulator [Solirubrobacterales bacterium]